MSEKYERKSAHEAPQPKQCKNVSQTNRKKHFNHEILSYFMYTTRKSSFFLSLSHSPFTCSFVLTRQMAEIKVLFNWLRNFSRNAKGGGGKETSALCLYSKKYFSKKYYNDEFLSASALRLRLKREVRRILDIK